MFDKTKIITFSEFYKLEKQQSELDFVDVPVSGQDIRLFIDPYAISRRDEPWYSQGAGMVYDFFDHLLDLIRLNQRQPALQLLDGLHESNETRLGYSPNNKGAGIGKKQSKQLYTALRASHAIVNTGIVKELSEFNLMVKGIDRDKVSDMTTNIIKSLLIEYTQRQCKLHGIKLTSKPVENIFNIDRFEWNSDYYDLPLDVVGKPVILVPKTIVRIIPSLDSRDYYQKHVLDYLQAELYSAGSSLGKLLADGSRRKPAKTAITEEVTGVGDPRDGKKALKDYLVEFSQANPTVLEDYEAIRKRESVELTNEELESPLKQRKQKYDDIIKSLKAIPKGKADAYNYHNFMVGALVAIFYPLLTNPQKETPINDKTKKIDITFVNSADYGFFSSLRSLKGIPATYIMFECKNYFEDIKNPEVDQLAMRLNDKRGRLGFLMYRSMENRDLLVKRCRAAVDGHGYVIPLSDIDVIKLLEMSGRGDDVGVDAFLETALKEIID